VLAALATTPALLVGGAFVLSLLVLKGQWYDGAPAFNGSVYTWAVVDGVTMDWRYSVIPSEEIRQTVVCQLLAYVELARLDPRARLRVEIVRHAEFLLGRLEEVRSYGPFDGMLAYSLLGAYEITQDPRFLDAGTLMMNDLLAIPTSQCVLNGGLMVAMATAEYWRLTGDAQAKLNTHDIVAQLGPYQNADGSVTVPLFCNEYCGLGHQSMWGRVRVTRP
jgi:hypothetical protein